MTRSFAEVITFVRCSVSDHELFVACSQQQVTWDGERVSACVFAYVCLCVVRLPRLSLPSVHQRRLNQVGLAMREFVSWAFHTVFPFGMVPLVQQKNK